MRRSTHTSFSCALSWLKGRWCFANSGKTAAGLLFGLSCLLVLTACGATSQQRLLYQASGIQVGLITDLSTNEHASPPVRNRHPADLTPKEIRSLVGSLEVSGWSGTILGLLTAPHPKPLFTEAERAELAEPLAAAFHAATPRERVFFAIQNPDAPYDTDRTSGSLFFRDDYLYVVLTDHYAFLQADPGGGEKRDPRDTKGMKLWVIGSARAATVPREKEPHWNAFEKVHISLTPVEILAGQRAPQSATSSSQSQVVLPAAGQPALKADTAATSATESVNDLRLQLRELTNANLDLRAQLKEQSDTIEKLKAEFEGLRNEKKPGPVKPSSGPTPSRKQATP
ncbi:MAG TPA: hypothetical protein VK901_08550 [Nitrospiraceae bacterium]|nr:hypothetical protein [Nitrospiraceae bacterium]